MSEAVEKSILVLANSIKKRGRCVAGVEITPAEGDEWSFEGWIRPVDPTQDEGMIPNHRVILNGRMLRPLECVKIRCSGPAGDPNHPEDWVIDPKAKWLRDGAFGSDVFEVLPDESGDLWGAASADSRRIPAGSADRTLRLVKRRESVLVEAYHEYNSFEGRDQFRSYISIRCRGDSHRFTITDPLFSSRHTISPNTVSKSEPRRFELKPDGLIIVVSLTPPFNGYQYKVAAAIIEP